MRNKLLIPILATLFLVVAIPTVYATVGDLEPKFDTWCKAKTSDKNTSAADFICNVDIYQMLADIKSTEIDVMDNSDAIKVTNNKADVVTREIHEDLNTIGVHINSLYEEVDDLQTRVTALDGIGESEITIFTEHDFYYRADKILLMGVVNDLDVTTANVQVYSFSADKIVSNYNVTIKDGGFEAHLSAGSPKWGNSGLYKIQVFVGEHMDFKTIGYLEDAREYPTN